MSNSSIPIKGVRVHEMRFQRDYDTWSEIIGPQNSNADVEIICQGGSVLAHAFVLRLVSPFMNELLADLGDKYMDVRKILMPDWSVTAVQKVIELVYFGSTTAASEKEGNIIKKIMKDLFQTKTVNISLLYGSESLEQDSFKLLHAEETPQMTDFEMVDVKVLNRNMTWPGTDLPTQPPSLTFETPSNYSVTEATCSTSADTMGLELSDSSSNSESPKRSRRSWKNLRKSQTLPVVTIEPLRLEHNPNHYDLQTRRGRTKVRRRTEYKCHKCSAVYKREHFFRRHQQKCIKDNTSLEPGMVQAEDVDMLDSEMRSQNVASTEVDVETPTLARTTPLYHPTRSESQGSEQISSLELSSFTIEPPRRSSRLKKKSESATSESLVASSKKKTNKQGKEEQCDSNQSVLRSSAKTNTRDKYDEEGEGIPIPRQKSRGRKMEKMSRIAPPTRGSGRRRRGRGSSSLSVSDLDSHSTEKVGANDFDSGLRVNEDSIGGTSKIFRQKPVGSQDFLAEEPALAQSKSNSNERARFQPLIPQELSVINMASIRKNRRNRKNVTDKSAKVNVQPLATKVILGAPQANVVEPAPSVPSDRSSAMLSSPQNTKVALVPIPPPEDDVDVLYVSVPPVDLAVNKFHSEMSFASFAEKAKECGECKTKYCDAIRSEQCIDSHNLTRCHFCLELFPDMATQLQHYTDIHGSRCWICGELVQFQNAEDHVFWEHLVND